MSHFLNLGFFKLTVLFICFSCCFSEDDNYVDRKDANQDQEIVFRIIRGTKAKLGDAPYQVRLSSELHK